MAGELTPTIAALLGRYDLLQEACRRGRKVVRDKRTEWDQCTERELEAATAYHEAYARAYLASSTDPALVLEGMKRPLEGQIKQHARLATMDQQRAWDVMVALEKSAERAYQEASRQLRNLEKEYETIQALAHAYNRELKVLEG